MARNARLSVRKREREHKKMEMAALKRERREQRKKNALLDNATPAPEDSDLPVTGTDIDPTNAHNSL